MNAIWRPCAPAKASQPPTDTTIISAAETSSSATTAPRVTRAAAVSRLGGSITTSAAIAARPYNLAAAGARPRRPARAWWNWQTRRL